MTGIRSLIEQLDQINESEEVNKAIKRGVDALPPKPTIADIERGMNSAVKQIRDQLQSRDSDSFIQSIERGAIRFGSSPDYIKRQYLGMTAEKLGLPGLYSMPTGDSFVYTDNKDPSGAYKSARFASIEDAIKLYQAGYVTPAKAKELQTKNINRAEFKVAPGPQAPAQADNAPAQSSNTNTSTTRVAGDSNPVQAFAVNPQARTDTKALPPALDLKKFINSKITANDLNGLDKTQLDDIALELQNELRKLLNVLNDSILNFKSAIALNLIESDIIVERDLEAADEEKLRTIVYNLKLLEPKVSPVVKARLGNYLAKVPTKYSSAAAPAATSRPASASTSSNAPVAGDNKNVSSKSKRITWQDLVKLNPEIKDANKIYPGQEIKLPNGSSAVVDQGDTLGKIAQRWNQGGYDDVDMPSGDSAAAPANSEPSSSSRPAPVNEPAAASTASSTEVPKIKPSEAASIALDIKKALATLKNQDSLDRIFMNIKSKENFDQIDAAFRRTSRKGVVDAVKDEWFYNKGKQFTPMLKRLGIEAQ